MFLKSLISKMCAKRHLSLVKCSYHTTQPRRDVLWLLFYQKIKSIRNLILLFINFFANRNWRRYSINPISGKKQASHRYYWSVHFFVSSSKEKFVSDIGIRTGAREASCFTCSSPVNKPSPEDRWNFPVLLRRGRLPRSWGLTYHSLLLPEGRSPEMQPHSHKIQLLHQITSYQNPKKHPCQQGCPHLCS